ncbi:MAG: TonB-dependent receptor [Ignavibacteriae bacterium]|nr:TonB-dependent receptor [Ignavibacteriota bacterium]
MSIIITNQSIYSQISDDSTKYYESLIKMLESKIDIDSKYEKTASKYIQSVLDAPASVSVITSDDIERYGYKTVAEALNSVRSFYIRNDRNYEYAGVRGIELPATYNSLILMLLDGHIMNDNIYWAPFIGNDFSLNMNLIDRIEIIRGPGAVLYGTSAVTAVINIITKSGNTLDGLNILGGTGSYRNRKACINYGNTISDIIDLSISAQYGHSKGRDLYFKEYDADSTNHGWAEGIDGEEYYGVYSSLKYKNLKLTGFYSIREKEIPTAAWEMTFNKLSKSTDIRSFLEIKYETSISKDFNFSSRIFYDNYKYKGYFPYELEQYEIDNGNWLGGEFEFIWDIFSDNRLTLGGQAKRNYQARIYLWDDSTNFFEGDFPYSLFSVYLQNNFQILENLSVGISLRDEYFELTKSNSLCPRASIIYNPSSNSSIKLLYNNAYRDPNIYEMYYNDGDLSESNLNLKPIIINSIEILYEQNIGDNLLGTVSCFYNKINDIIESVLDSSNNLNQFRNISNVNTIGMEFEIQSKFKSGLWSYLSFSFQRSKYQGTNEFVLNSPEYMLKGGISYGFFNYLFIGLDIDIESGRKTIYNTWTEPFCINNLSFSFLPHSNSVNSEEELINRLNFTFRVNNLFDVQYELPGGPENLQNAFLQNGANFIFETSIKF